MVLRHDQLRDWFVIFPILCLSVLTGCSTVGISINRVEPPKYPISGGKTLAVLNFKSPDNFPDAGERIASAFISNLIPSGYYRIMERARMESILAEQRFSQSAYVDPDQASKVGKLLDVDYIITGEVTAYTVEDQENFEKEMRTRIAGYYIDNYGRQQANVETYWVDIPVMVRSAAVAASFRLINVETGEVIVGQSRGAEATEKSGGTRGASALPSREAMVGRLTNEVTAFFTNLIAPHPVADHRTLQKGKTPACKQGVKLAQSGLWDRAEELWQTARSQRPDDPAPLNNLGVAFEIRGDYENAAKLYSQALQIKPAEQIYMNHLRQVRDLLNLYNREYTR